MPRPGDACTAAPLTLSTVHMSVATILTAPTAIRTELGSVGHGIQTKQTMYPVLRCIDANDDCGVFEPCVWAPCKHVLCTYRWHARVAPWVPGGRGQKLAHHCTRPAHTGQSLLL